MSQADKLLDNMSEEEITAYLADAASEEHIVIGNDRFITVPESLRRIAVQHDHNAETVTFDCPRFWDGVDMSDKTIYINYMRPNGTKARYLASEDEDGNRTVAVDTTDANIMHFNWTISKYVTEFNGLLKFLVCIDEVDTNGEETFHWNSELNSQLRISEGMETDELEDPPTADIITQILLRMGSFEDSVADALKELEEAEKLVDEAAKSAEETKKIAEEIDNKGYVLGDENITANNFVTYDKTTKKLKDSGNNPNSFVKRVTNTDNLVIIYGESQTGKATMYRAKTSITGTENYSTIPLRDGTTHTFDVGDPTKDSHPVNLGYLKDLNYLTENDLAKIESLVTSDAGLKLSDELILTSDFGDYKVPQEGYLHVGMKPDGSLMTLRELLESAYSKTFDPEIVQPSIEVSLSQTEFEVTNRPLTFDATINFDPGSYQYDSRTGVVPWKYVITDVESEVPTPIVKETTDTSVTFNDVLIYPVTEETSKEYKCEVYYRSGNPAHNNKGESTALAIEEGVVSANVIITYHRACFYKINTGDALGTLDSQVKSSWIRENCTRVYKLSDLPTQITCENLRSIFWFIPEGRVSDVTVESGDSEYYVDDNVFLYPPELKIYGDFDLEENDSDPITYKVFKLYNYEPEDGEKTYSITYKEVTE